MAVASTGVLSFSQAVWIGLFRPPQVLPVTLFREEETDAQLEMCSLGHPTGSGRAGIHT